MSLKPWREVAIPQPDVREGKFQQAEFAADITAVHQGKATLEYQDAKAFFQRTFITEGMRLLLVQVAQRWSGKGGDPVIQLQTAFGGGKTHTLLAVYHLATRKYALSDLSGIPDVIDKAGLNDLPLSRVVVLDGSAHSPGQPWKHGKQSIHTLWGEMAWQLGGMEAFSLVKEADATGTSPGKDLLKALLERYAPCVVLVDELLAYMRQFLEKQTLSGGSLDSNLSFVQALTESCKLVPTAVMLASLPESEIEAGSQHGIKALKHLEKIFGRVQSLWKPVGTEESFEIVRRRLFEQIGDEKAREDVCNAYRNAYTSDASKFPVKTQESHYFERLMNAYPIHPELFDRLFEDWTTIEGFQRTRGVLKLMAKIIYCLWTKNDRDLMIMPGSIPLYDTSTRHEMSYYLRSGWDAVLEKDIDGERSETSDLEKKEPRFGSISAARRVARTIFLGSAPSSVAAKPGIRGLNIASILLGCLEPGQAYSIYVDALRRMAERLHYINGSGDRTQEAIRYWFDIRANLRREMEERKNRFQDRKECNDKLYKVMDKLLNKIPLFDARHIFTNHSDVPDDAALRLVILTPEQSYSNEEKENRASDVILEYHRNHGSKPRYFCNRLLFLGCDINGNSGLYDGIRTVLAWSSIVDDVKEKKLVLDNLQSDQAQKESSRAEEVLQRMARDCYKWLLCPGQQNPHEPKLMIEARAVNTNGIWGNEIEKVCLENEWIITEWAPVHLSKELQKFYWKKEKPAASAMSFWKDALRYLYLPRLKDKRVLEQAIQKGTLDYFGIAYGQEDGFALRTGNCNAIKMDETLLLIEPEAAKAYTISQSAQTIEEEKTTFVNTCQQAENKPKHPLPSQARAFIGTAEVNPATAKMKLVQIAEEIINVLATDPDANIKISMEISADFPKGVSEAIKRAVSENASILGFKNKEWE